MFKKNYGINGTPDAIGRAEVTPDFGVKVINPAIVLTQKGMTITADQIDPSAQIDFSVEKVPNSRGDSYNDNPVKKTIHHTEYFRYVQESYHWKPTNR